VIIVAGCLTVAEADRATYLDDCTSVVAKARADSGCHEFSISADLIDNSRIVIYERWESQQAVETFRGSGPSADQTSAVLAASVMEYDVTVSRTLM
jgi:quinol monooxygenase YgiN